MNLLRCYQICYIESKKNWMIVIKFEGECIKTIEWFKLYINCIKPNKKTTYLAVPNDVRLNRRNNKWDWWSIKVSTPNNGMLLVFHNCINTKQTNTLALMFPMMVDWIEKKLKYDLQYTNSNNDNRSYKNVI